ncbi:Peptidoglycan-recognition protein SC2 [Frankliniella fusca]|uniref:Peptidoglycan-recognition protein SC2 n=1 Tax=Frankliniella fusca TaxID=407009 RepID=A0AAE1GUF1_9NEOP|nr:Peptidoglycan-recognition protein SC2 [Frankliniella fusca]
MHTHGIAHAAAADLAEDVLDDPQAHDHDDGDPDSDAWSQSTNTSGGDDDAPRPAPLATPATSFGSVAVENSSGVYIGSTIIRIDEGAHVTLVVPRDSLPALPPSAAPNLPLQDQRLPALLPSTVREELRPPEEVPPAGHQEHERRVQEQPPPASQPIPVQHLHESDRQDISPVDPAYVSKTSKWRLIKTALGGPKIRIAAVGLLLAASCAAVALAVQGPKELDDTTDTNESTPRSTSTLPPYASTLPPLTSTLPPLTSALPPLTSALPPLTSALPPLTSTSTPTLPSTPSTPTPTCSPTTSFLVPRDEWGARKPSGSMSSLQLPVTLVVGYHISKYNYDICDDRAMCAELVRELQARDMDSSGFEDIAYNFVLGGDGSNVFEGRGWYLEGRYSKDESWSKTSILVAVVDGFEPIMGVPTRWYDRDGIRDLVDLGTHLGALENVTFRTTYKWK